MKRIYFFSLFLLLISCNEKGKKTSKSEIKFDKDVNSISKEVEIESEKPEAITYIANEGFLDNLIESEKELYSWQYEIAKKNKKNILDYYLLLPETLLNAELSKSYKTKKSRLDSTLQKPINGKISIKAGYLTAMPDMALTMTLFKDRKNKKDIIGIELGCGEPPIQYCDYGFIEFNLKLNKWVINNSVFPWGKFNKYCMEYAKKKSVENNEDIFWANIILPEFGTTLKIIDAYDSGERNILKGIWNGQRFELKKTFANKK